MSERLELADVNVLVALVVTNHEGHEHARAWQASTARYATTPLTETGLLRLLMNPAVSADGRPLGIAGALAALGAVKQHRAAEFVADDVSLAAPNAVMDHVTGHRQIPGTLLLNLALAHDGVLVTFDAKLASSSPTRLRKHVRTLPG